ncbi:hypothetical protein TRIUR3_13984 [Triticum urartu]|uniref:Uncharacterized protein n=1 Tax=Triticum urartu TaxID=4572 RepID=M7ZXI3_TRIUA|nr:hypothetical protein TRIUR3_13984 [Triticum urartu]
MGFIMEFAENLILRLMEDPDQRDEAQRAHVYRMKERQAAGRRDPYDDLLARHAGPAPPSSS